METFSFKPSTANQDRVSLPQSVINQNFPWSEPEDDWDLRQFLSILKRRSLTIIGVAVLVMAGFMTYALNQKSEYQGKFQILAEPVNSDSNLTTINPIPSIVESKLSKSGLDYETQIQVMKSPELLTQVVQNLQTSYPNINYNNLNNSLTIKRLGETKIIEVGYKDNSPVKIQEVLDTLAKAYLKYSLDNRQTNLRQGLDFVEQQLPPIQNKVNDLQQQLQQFRQKYNFINPETQSAQIASQISSLTDKRVEVNQQLANAQTQLANMQVQTGALAVLDEAPVYQQLIIQLHELEAQQAAESTRFRENAIPMQVLQEKREKMLPLLQQEARRVLYVKQAEAINQVQKLQQQSQVLNAAENQLQKQVRELSFLSRNYTELSSQLSLATESLNRFLATREKLQIEVAQTQIPWQIIEAAVLPDNPISPNIQRQLILGFVLSSIVGIGSGLLLEKLDTKYHTLEAFKEKLKLPLLANIPFEKQLLPTLESKSISQTARLTQRSDWGTVVNQLTLTQDRQGYHQSPRFLEAFRVLHTNTQLLSSDEPIRSVIISSALSGDGKSTVAFHLALIASAMGQRVLLVDADMRKPQIHALSGLNNLWGLSSVISGNLPVETAIRQIPAHKELSIITAGPIPPDPTKLLSSQKMRQLMADFSQAFDLVIYDAPPLVGLADASLLSPHTDGVIFVARMHKTDRSAVAQAIDGLNMARTNVLGMVINGTKKNDYQGYYYYQ